jgi:uncharacterized membrane protein
MELLWYFFLYSFLGLCMERVFARLVRHSDAPRRCRLLLPLCPVYGVGALAIVSLPEAVVQVPGRLFLAGAVCASLAEYAASLFYQMAWGVSFWDYSAHRGNVDGRICLPFSIAWGLLCIPLVRFLHPLLLALPFAPPPFVTLLAALALTADAAISSVLLLGSGTRDCLNWDKK